MGADGDRLGSLSGSPPPSLLLRLLTQASRKPERPHPGVEREGLPGLSSPPDLHSPGAPQERKPACPRTRFQVLKPLGVAPPGRRYPSRPTTESLKRVTRTSPEALSPP